MIRSLVVGLGGSRAFRATQPSMIGIIAGELLSGLSWIVAGATYYATMGLIPTQSTVFMN